MDEKESQQTEESTQTEETAPKKKKGKLGLILIILAVVCIIGAALYFFVFADSPEKHFKAAVAALTAGDFTTAEKELKVSPQDNNTATAQALLAVLLKNEACLNLEAEQESAAIDLQSVQDMNLLITQLSEASVISTPPELQQLITRLTCSALVLNSAEQEVEHHFLAPMTEAWGIVDDWQRIRSGNSFTAGTEASRWRDWEKKANAAADYYEKTAGRKGLGSEIAAELTNGLNFMAETLELGIKEGAFQAGSVIHISEGSFTAEADRRCTPAHTKEDLQRAADQLHLLLYRAEMNQYSAESLQTPAATESAESDSKQDKKAKKGESDASSDMPESAV